MAISSHRATDSSKAETNRWRANPVAITLFRLILHLMRRVVYIALTVLLALVIAVSFLVQRRHAAKAAKTQLRYRKMLPLI